MSTPRRTRRHVSAPRPPLALVLADSVLFYGMLAVLAFNQLAFGGVYLNAQTPTSIGCAALLLVLFASRCWIARLPDETAAVFRPVAVPARLAVPLLLLGLLPLLQLVPLPPGLVRALSPAGAARWDLPTINGVTDGLGWIPLSIDPQRTLDDIVKYAPALFFFFIACATLRTTERVRTLAFCLVAMGLFQCFYGTYQTFGPRQSIWWWENTLHPGFVTGTYLNRNHLAGFLELCIPVSVALAVWLRGRVRHKARARSRNGVPLVVRLQSDAGFLVPVLFITTLFLTGSRGGMISALLAGAVLALAGAAARSRIRVTRFALLGSIPVLLALAFIGTSHVLQRFVSFEELKMRLDIFRSSLPLLQDNPLTGVGLGNFNEAYSAVAMPKFAGLTNLFYTHNDWLQIGIELGLPGLLLAAALSATLIAACFRSWDMPSRALNRGMARAVSFFFVSIALHNLVDFNFHVPANLFCFAAVSALPLLFLTAPLQSAEDTAPEHGRSARRERALLQPGLALGLLALAVACAWQADLRLRAETFHPVRENMTRPLAVLPKERLTRSLEVEPGNPNRIRELGKLYLFAASGDPRLDAFTLRTAAEYFKQAARLQPSNEENWFYLYLCAINAPDLRHEEYEAAEHYLDTVLMLAPRNPQIFFSLALANYALEERAYFEEDRRRYHTAAFAYLRHAAAGSEEWKDLGIWRDHRDMLPALVRTDRERAELTEAAEHEWLVRSLKHWFGAK